MSYLFFQDYTLAAGKRCKDYPILETHTFFFVTGTSFFVKGLFFNVIGRRYFAPVRFLKLPEVTLFYISAAMYS
ncbi:MAG: hypothetical protein WKI04_15365 [Ferruginibacter sp.]